MTKDKIVTTYTGKQVPRKKCKRIKNSFYVVGDPTVKDSGECYLIEGKYHRFNNGYIEFDHEQGRYVLVHKTTLREGVIDINGDTLEKGMFSPNLTKNVDIVTDYGKTSQSKQLCINEEVAKKGSYREKFSNGLFYPNKTNTASWFTAIKNAPISKSSLQYESRFVSNLTENVYNENYHPVMNNSNINALGDFLSENGITFGVEFETISGYIPDRICHKLGLIPLRDGSISGIEYVTIPLSDRKGLYALKEICEEMAKRTRYDMSCALHLHLGGLTRQEDSILASFILGCLVQEEQFLLQPDYKRNNKVQRQNYCSPLPTKDLFEKLPTKMGPEELKSQFAKFFYFISDKKEYSNYKNSLDNISTHPSDPAGDRKWNIKSRYYYINFVPIIFGNKKTIEFRHHNITNDFFKIVNFLFNCATFVWTVENCKKELFEEKSPLFSKLLKNPHKSCEILSENLLKTKGYGLEAIIAGNNRYNSQRKAIMRKMHDKGDETGSREKSFNKEYNSSIKTLW